MRRIGLVAFLSVSAYAGLASAQGAPGAPGADKSNGQFDLRQNKAGDADVAAARGRAAAGDCVGALENFDQALKTSQDPEVRRDRGLCHEKLGNKYPALEDLRAYVAARPNAPDAEQLRQRVQQLEGQLDTNKPINSGAKKDAAAETDADVYASRRGEEKERGGSNAIGAKPGEQEKDYEFYKKQERLADEAKSSALRYGSGLVVGAFIGVPRYFIVDGNTSDFSYMAGARAGYSTGKYVTLYGEFGLSGFVAAGEGRDRSRNSNTGVLTALGMEVRLGFTERMTDQVLLRLGVGYEHLVNESNRAVTHLVPGRIGLGYRHVFGPSVGLDILLDGGPGVSFNEDGDSQFFIAIAGNVGLSVGF